MKVTKAAAPAPSATATSQQWTRRASAVASGRRRAVETLLRDSEWSTWSDREIARQCGVSDRTVNRMRDEFTATMSQSEPTQRTYTDRHGNVTTMDTSRIGRGQQTIDDWTDGFAEKCDDHDSANWQGFDPPIYNVWKQPPHSNTK